jgi:hypothetical protein
MLVFEETKEDLTLHVDHDGPRQAWARLLGITYRHGINV